MQQPTLSLSQPGCGGATPNPLTKHPPAGQLTPYNVVPSNKVVQHGLLLKANLRLTHPALRGAVGGALHAEPFLPLLELLLAPLLGVFEPSRVAQFLQLWHLPEELLVRRHDARALLLC